MSETKTTRKQLPAYLILALIALAAALLLAVTNAITAGPIKAHEEAAQNAAFQSVMTADSFSTMSVPDGYNVTSLVEAKKDGKTIGYCAVSSAKGYGGNVAVTLGVDMDGKIVGCQIGDTNFAETDGFGARWKEPARAEAFIGLSAFGGDTIEAITGATVTSKAVLAASNDVLKCISHVLGKDVEGDVLAFGVKEEKPVQAVELTGDVHQGKAVGFGNGEVTARLTLNDDGTIAALVRGRCSGAMLNFGGNVYAVGTKPDGSAYRVGVQDPDAPNNSSPIGAFPLMDPSAVTSGPIGVVSVIDRSVVTSGIYERGFTIDGVRYHHILSPWTGLPSDSDLASATIIAESSMDADALATACIVLGSEKALQLTQENGYPALMILRDGTVMMNDLMKQWGYTSLR